MRCWCSGGTGGTLGDTYGAGASPCSFFPFAPFPLQPCGGPMVQCSAFCLLAGDLSLTCSSRNLSDRQLQPDKRLFDTDKLPFLCCLCLLCDQTLAWTFSARSPSCCHLKNLLPQVNRLQNVLNTKNETRATAHKQSENTRSQS